jgi:hypothetical protein
MNRVSPKVLWPLALAVIFFAIPAGLHFFYPSLFWRVTDNEPHGLSNALNMAYRLGDGRMYAAPGMTNHPGVTFYIMSWLALALAGYPVANGGFDFFKTVLAHVEDFHRILIWLAAFAGAAGVYIFVRAARILVSVNVIIFGLLLWLLSTPATIMMFMSPGFESFALLINSLFFTALVQIACSRDVGWRPIVFAGAVAAVAYLNKLSYVYVPAALGAAIFVRLAASRAGWLRGTALLALFVAAFVSFVLVVAYFVIGWAEFQALLDYHYHVIVGSGMYGEGDRTVVSADEVRNALAAIPANRAYALPLALGGGVVLAVAGIMLAFTRSQHIPLAVLGIGAGTAALLSAVVVLKHYEVHYTAGISATLPACVVVGDLLARARGLKFGSTGGVIAGIALMLMALFVVPNLTTYVTGRAQVARLAEADKKEIDAQIAAGNRMAEFMYRVPFAEFGQGFVLVLTGVPQLIEEYLRTSRRTISSFMARQSSPDVGMYVIDKAYFPDEAAVKRATNLDLPEASAPAVIRYEAGDRLIELRTVFLLIRH